MSSRILGNSTKVAGLSICLRMPLLQILTLYRYPEIRPVKENG